MEDEHREAIRRNISSLVNQTDLEKMRSALYEKGIFTEHNMETYNDPSSTSMHRKRCMYNDLMRRGPRAFNILLETLEENGYWDLVRMLDPTSILNTYSHNSSSHMKENPNKFVSLHKGNNDKEPPKISVEQASSEPSGDSLLAAANNNIPPPTFQVKKSEKFMDDQNSGELGVYSRAGRERGVVVLFTYVSFRNNVEKYRAGALRDLHNLKHLFGEMGFKVLSYLNLELGETRRALAEMRGLRPPAPRCLFLVVSSHGHERAGGADTDIRCADGGLLPLREIISHFSNDNLPLLSDVPKVFIFQTCRGTLHEYALRPARLAELDGTRAAGPNAAAPPAPAPPYSNVLVVQSTLPGFVSRRDPEHGSWYIQALCEVFAARAHDCHVDKLFTLVDERLRERFHIQTSSVDRWGFNRRLYLYPGLND